MINTVVILILCRILTKIFKFNNLKTTENITNDPEYKD